MVNSLKNIREIHNHGSGTREWMVSSHRLPMLGGKQTRFAGYTEAARGYSFARHDPNFSMVLVSEKGEGLVWCDGQWRSCPSGYAYITPPRVPHAYKISGKKTWRLHWVIYEESAQLPGVACGEEPRLVEVEATGFRHAVEGLCNEDTGQGSPSVLEFWAALVDRLSQRLFTSDSQHSRLDRLWLAVHAKLGDRWTLSRLAESAGMSEESLRRACIQNLNCPPMAYLTRLRMLAAADMLCYSTEKVASIAERVGYGDAFSFSTAFRRVIGQSPRQYRRGV